METQDKLSMAGRFELQRRINIAKACVDGCMTFAWKVFEAERTLDEYKKSKLFAWTIGITVACLFAGRYLWAALYTPIVWTVPMAVGRLVDQNVQEKAVQRHTEQLALVRVLWETGGHYEQFFYDLTKMMKAAHPDFDLNSDEYEAWWKGVCAYAKRAVVMVEMP